MSSEAIDQEPIGEIVGLMLCENIINFYSITPYTQKRIPVGTKVYISPQREWQGLTDEEIKEIIGPWGDTPIKGYTRKLFDQIEVKLKEKNGL
jgi:hypothetical protein